LSLLFSALILISCAEEKQETVVHSCVRDFEEIKSDSVLIVLAENSPASYFVYRGRNMGYEYELLYEFSKDVGVRLQVKMVHNLDSMVHLLNDCQGDII